MAAEARARKEVLPVGVRADESVARIRASSSFTTLCLTLVLRWQLQASAAPPSLNHTSSSSFNASLSNLS
jgi:hypothetical protein